MLDLMIHIKVYFKYLFFYQLHAGKCTRYYHHLAADCHIRPISLQAGATYRHWRWDMHSDVISVYGGVQPRPLVR